MERWILWTFSLTPGIYQDILTDTYILYKQYIHLSHFDYIVFLFSFHNLIMAFTSGRSIVCGWTRPIGPWTLTSSHPWYPRYQFKACTFTGCKITYTWSYGVSTEWLFPNLMVSDGIEKYVVLYGAIFLYVSWSCLLVWWLFHCLLNVIRRVYTCRLYNYYFFICLFENAIATEIIFDKLKFCLNSTDIVI